MLSVKASIKLIVFCEKENNRDSVPTYMQILVLGRTLYNWEDM